VKRKELSSWNALVHVEQVLSVLSTSAKNLVLSMSSCNVLVHVALDTSVEHKRKKSSASYVPPVSCRRRTAARSLRRAPIVT
jgi:hypothetical protein